MGQDGTIQQLSARAAALLLPDIFIFILIVFFCMDGCRCNVVVSGRQAGSPWGLLYICIDRLSVSNQVDLRGICLLDWVRVVGMKCVAGRQAGRQASSYIYIYTNALLY